MSVSPGFEDGLEIDHGHGRRVRDLFDKVLECPAEDRERLLDDMARGSGDGLETIDEVRALLSFVDATRIDDEQTEAVLKLIDRLEQDEDVQDVFHNLQG